MGKYEYEVWNYLPAGVGKSRKFYLLKVPVMKAGILIEMLSFHLRIIWLISEDLKIDDGIFKVLKYLNQLLCLDAKTI
jgi:hypothetical protein